MRQGGWFDTGRPGVESEGRFAVVLPSYATDIWEYFSAFMAWDVITVVIGIVGIAIAATVVKLVWSIIHKGQ